jgi:hypothetical protein
MAATGSPSAAAPALRTLGHPVFDRDESIRLVATDGSGSTPPVSIVVPDLQAQGLGFPNIGPGTAWMAAVD